jgi:hypothetical protein
MPMYDPSGLYVDPILTDFSVGYGDVNLIGLQVMPSAEAGSPSGSYRIFDRSSRVIFPDRREPGTVANEIRGGKWASDVFSTKQRSLQAAVADEEEAYLNSVGGLSGSAFGGGLQLNPHEDAAALVLSSLGLGHEFRVQSLVRNTANYPAGHTITLGAPDQWDNYAGATSDPLLVIRNALIKVNSKIGQPPNTMVLPRLGVPWLENHPDIVGRFQSFMLTDPNAFQRLTGFEGQIILADVLYNAADNIDATESLTSLWGKDVWLGFVNSSMGLRDLSFGKTFFWPPGGVGSELQPTERWREEGRKSDLVRTTWQYDLKITNSSAGYLIVNAFSATAF